MHRVFLRRVTVQRWADAENHALIHDDKSSRYLKQGRLDFRAVFHLDGDVPADDQVTSVTGVGGSGPVAFATTHWSVGLEAQGESPAAQEALEGLCRTYWRPIYAFLRRGGIRPAEAGELPQGCFFCIFRVKIFNIRLLDTRVCG